MPDRTINFHHVSKRFRRGERHNSLRDLVPGLVRRTLRGFGPPPPEQDEFWALRDVSFALGPGEALGIIGPNGAGKSTTLKLLTRILRPTEGHCEIQGRVGALIEVAAGFHPDLTGRENIFLQGAIMGMRQADIVRKFDEIVDFSGVGPEFIETPVKRYSSGMNARLGFAVAAHLDPDVLIIDEVLSVGDAGFRDKCVARMKTLIARGIPLVFVSHNLPTVLSLCSRVILLQGGQVAFDGQPEQGVREYLRARWDRQQDVTDADAGRAPIVIEGVDLLGARDEPCETFRTGDPMHVRIRYRARQPVARPQFSVQVLGTDLTDCATLATHLDRYDCGTVAGPGSVTLSIPDLPLLGGTFTLSVGILNTAGAEAYDRHECAYPFSVVADAKEHGFVRIPHRWAHAGAPEGSGARVLPIEQGLARARAGRTTRVEEAAAVADGTS